MRHTETAQLKGTEVDFIEQDAQLMRRALELAARGPRGANPQVGAVVVSAAGHPLGEGRILGEGWHHGAGTPHAEPTALADARERGHDVRGARMYVTLEPCNHTGRTGPCSHAVAEAGIGELVYAAADSTAEAHGGAAWLQAHGVMARGGLLAEDSEQLNARWLRRMAEQRPFVTAKMATSLDFALAAADGTSQWITSEESRRHAQQLRRRADAVVVGSGTLAADDPRLTAREDSGELSQRQPLRVVIGESEVPASARIRGEDGLFVHLPTRDLREALAELTARGVHHVMVEGGPRLLGAFFDAGLVDEVWHYQAPLLLPGGRRAAGDAPVPTLADAVRHSIDELRQIGPDIFIRYTPPVEGTPCSLES